MSLVNISSIFIKNSSAPFLAPFCFTVVVESLKKVSNPIEFKFVYIGSAESQKYDQVLDTFEVGPLPLGVSQFDCEINVPDPSLIPMKDLLGVTAMMITTSYKGKEFFRVGYYIYNSLPDLDQADGIIAPQIDVSQIQRSILVDKPKIINNPIDWEEQEKDMQLMTQILGGVEEPSRANENWLNFSNNSINFNGLFKNSTATEFTKPALNNGLWSNQFNTSNNNNPSGTFNQSNERSESSFNSNIQQNPSNHYQSSLFNKENVAAMGMQQSGYEMQKPLFDNNAQINQYHQPMNSGFGIFGQSYQ